jgi:trehalose-phosphatase
LQERSRVGLKHALDSTEEIAARLAGKRAGLLLDYDGTLTPIVDEPDAAALSDGMRATLRKVAQRMSVAVISGRDLEDVRRMAGLPSIAYAGSHGFDMRLPNGKRVEHEGGLQLVPALDAAEAELRARQPLLPGLRIERKKFAIAAHYRRASDGEVAAIELAVDEVLRHHRVLRKSGGKKVFELRPDVDWHKGRAVRWLIDELGLGDGVPVYIGDDETDEDAFEALRGRGITVAVQEAGRATAAQYYLEDTAGVERFLDWLAGAIDS